MNGNTGDSAVTMGRIGWQDALARQSVGGAAAAAVLEGTLLAPLQRDLLARTWLPERYDCQGRDAHNPYYFVSLRTRPEGAPPPSITPEKRA